MYWKKFIFFDFSDLSHFRIELMGIGILGVMVAHTLAWMNISHSFLYYPLNLFSRLVFTEGFLFLSGFGLYYSLTKDNRLSNFYLKRFWRVFFPFLVITFPILRWLGKYTLELYVLHMSLYILYSSFFNGDSIFHIIGVILVFILSLIICSPLQNVITIFSKFIQQQTNISNK